MPQPTSTRIQIQDVEPQVDGGRYPVKASVGDRVRVGATIFRDGHEQLAGVVRSRPPGARRWRESPLAALGNDRFEASFDVDVQGRWSFQVEAWRDRVASFQDELRRKVEAGQEDLSGELAEGAALLALESLTVDEALAVSASDHSERVASATLTVDVDRERARFGAWYELFPRSWGGFKGVTKIAPRLAELGFDVIYLPPVHPIGTTNRKGRNNTLVAAKGDPGSPWAIGGPDGGHDAIHPELGTLAEFDELVAAAREHGLEIALDFAIQCSPDHPWLTEHPEWFRRRADGSIRYAENPPKKYEDIVNVDFYADGAIPELWLALRDVVLHWADEGVRIFRVDNPHTKPLPFWEWMIADVRGRHPDVIFLAEALTRPTMMYRLGKIGFSQSYTYFTWRNTKSEITDYLRELTTTEVADYYRPNFFVNTPDINPYFLQSSGRAGFLIRAALAATLSGLWGVYSGFELCEAAALPGREEYLDSEKYEIRVRDPKAPNITAEITALNRIRNANPAL